MDTSSPRSHIHLPEGKSIPRNIVEVVQSIYKEQSKTVLSKIGSLPEDVKEKVFTLIQEVDEAIKHNTNVFENRMKDILLGRDNDNDMDSLKQTETFMIESRNQ